MAAYQPNGAPPPSSTNQRVVGYGKMFTNDGRMDEPSQPRAIETHEVPLFVEEFVQAARNAMKAGAWSIMPFNSCFKVQNLCKTRTSYHGLS